MKIMQELQLGPFWPVQVYLPGLFTFQIHKADRGLYNNLHAII